MMTEYEIKEKITAEEAKHMADKRDLYHDDICTQLDYTNRIIHRRALNGDYIAKIVLIRDLSFKQYKEIRKYYKNLGYKISFFIKYFDEDPYYYVSWY